MKKNDPTLPALFSGDERSTVLQSRPRAIGEFNRRFSEDLTGNGDVARNLESVEGTGVAEGAEVLGLGPSQGAAEIAPPRSELHRNEIVHLVRHARTGKADQNASIANKVGDAIMIRARNTSDIGEHQHRTIAGEQF